MIFSSSPTAMGKEKQVDEDLEGQWDVQCELNENHLGVVGKGRGHL